VFFSGRQVDASSREISRNVESRCVRATNFKNKAAIAPVELQARKKIIRQNSKFLKLATFDLVMDMSSIDISYAHK
jgi:hypothetical protein